ncbi:MAG: hypothetical protein JXQ72_09155 [Anaerolineae bacterium]|nr:hypothetical protein [Anaerolineae bacterium]
MLSQYDPIKVDFILREESAPPPFPPATDRAAWNAIKDAVGAEQVNAIIAAAEIAAREPIPELPATLFLEFFRSGSRQEYETPWFHRRDMMAELAIAECLENQGRFLDPLLNVAWAICEESSWEFPAHHHDLPDVERPTIGLFAALTGTQLAELVLLIGEHMHPLLEKRIRHEVDQRILTPFLTRHDFWWLHHTPGNTTCNWTAVCSGNVIATAIYLECDRARLAEVIARGARSLDDYLETFDSEGGSTEGPGYWGFGFGNYVLAGHLVHQRTNGRIDFFADDLVRKIALFPLRTMLSPNTFVNFSDCDPDITLPVPLLVFLAQHYRVDGLMQLANMQRQRPPHHHNSALSWMLRDLVWRPDPALDQPAIPAQHDWYPDMQWMIARFNPADPDALVLAVKGGHNNEMHNQNDVGNIIVHHHRTSPVADIGRGRYTRAYFAAGRYEFFMNTSLGHSLPVPNGCAQLPGETYAAYVLEHRADDTGDLLRLDLKAAYPPEADLAALVRTVTLHRDSGHGWVELVDEVTFESGAGTFESVLTTFGSAEIGSDTVQINVDGVLLEIDYDPSVVAARVEVMNDVDLAAGPRDVTRVIFALPVLAKMAQVRLCIKALTG